MNKCLCDKCGAEFEVIPRHRTDGDLDITYIQCSRCKEEYIVSVTDSVLRKAITKWAGLWKRIRATTDAKTSDRLMKRTEEMKNKNHNQCRELIDEHINK